MGHPRSSPMSQFNKAYSTLIETVSLLYYFSDIASWAYLSKFADPTCIWHPIQGDPGRKTRLPGLLCGIVCVILCLAVLVELRLVTDRQTDTGP